ncbi:hypothetical protein EYF80_003728 [Liparis tanakae]|uniref:Uncharacterized protein n=1 Tax=Liparis tanakae TaxID=230148 RepID=A0A4Z2J7J1_9TELE|nr:hypothetical protein EYF80_003728 [Liparis tanakae]
MSSRSSAWSRYSQKSCVVSRRACFLLVSLYAMSTRQPRMLMGCSSSSAAPPMRNSEWERSTEKTRFQGRMPLPTFCGAKDETRFLMAPTLPFSVRICLKCSHPSCRTSLYVMFPSSEPPVKDNNTTETAFLTGRRLRPHLSATDGTHEKTRPSSLNVLSPSSHDLERSVVMARR